MHGLAGQQVGGGLAGALIVLPAVAPTPGSLPERVILIKNSTYAINAVPANRVVEARLALAQHKPRLAVAPPRAPHAIDPFNPPSWPSGWPIPAGAKRCNPPASAFMSHWVVNSYPVGDPKVSVKPASATLGVGARQLYRIIDATSDSYASIEMFGAQGQQENLNVVGRDGVPIDPHGNPEGLVAPFKNVLLPPAGRVDIVVTGDSQPQMLVAGNVCTGYLGELIPRRTLLVIRPSTAASASGLRRPAPLPIATTGQTSASALYRMNEHAITKRRAITFTQYADQNNPSQNQAWYVTDTSANPTGFIEQPFWLSPDPAHRGEYLPEIDVPQNSIEEWTLVNASGEIHAFHIHQLTFVTFSNPEFEGPHLPVFQDTVALPPAVIDRNAPANPPSPYVALSKTVVRIDFRHVHRGTFVFHCHMLFHEDHGMMGIIRVY
ncbi:MAG: multicopper oxidase domain-containing protein [Vulcanimicrobiaceae bacterium]